MPFVPVPNTVQARLHFINGNAEEIVNVLHYVKEPAAVIDLAQADGLAAALRLAWNTRLSPKVTNQVTMDSITIKDVSAPDLPSFLVPEAAFGADAGDPLPAQTALAVTLYTASGSRGGRGRIYLGGFTENDNSVIGGADDATVVAATQFVNDITEIVVAGAPGPFTYTLGVASRAAHVGSSPAGAPVAPITRPIINHTVNHRWDTQRRRANKNRF